MLGSGCEELVLLFAGFEPAVATFDLLNEWVPCLKWPEPKTDLTRRLTGE